MSFISDHRRFKSLQGLRGGSNGFPGEKHQPLLVPGVGFQTANFSGPGTHLRERLRRGDKPLTATDAVALGHDLSYTIHGGDAVKIREADQKMVSDLSIIQKNKWDSKVNTIPAKLAIETKMKLEDAGILQSSKFAPTIPTLTEEDKILLEQTMEQVKEKGVPQEGGKKGSAAGLLAKLLKQTGSGETEASGEQTNTEDLVAEINNILDQTDAILAGSGKMSKIEKKIQRQQQKTLLKQAKADTKIVGQLGKNDLSELKGDNKLSRQATATDLAIERGETQSVKQDNAAARREGLVQTAQDIKAVTDTALDYAEKGAKYFNVKGALQDKALDLIKGMGKKKKGRGQKKKPLDPMRFSGLFKKISKAKRNKVVRTAVTRILEKIKGRQGTQKIKGGAKSTRIVGAWLKKHFPGKKDQNPIAAREFICQLGKQFDLSSDSWLGDPSLKGEIMLAFEEAQNEIKSVS